MIKRLFLFFSIFISLFALSGVMLESNTVNAWACWQSFGDPQPDDYCSCDGSCDASFSCPADPGTCASGVYGTLAGECGDTSVCTSYDAYGNCLAYTISYEGAWCERWNGCCVPGGGGATPTPGGGGPTSTPAPSCTPPSTPSSSSPSGLLACGTTTVNLTWSSVAGVSEYALRIDDTSNPWSGDCSAPNPGDSCTLVNGTSYNLSVSAGRTYAWWVHSTGSSCGWSAPRSNSFTVPSVCGGATCTISVSPNPIGVNVGGNQNITATVVPTGGTIDQVRFTSAATTVATATSPDLSASYTSTITGAGLGSTSVLVEGIMGGVSTCAVTVPVNVSNTSTGVIGISDITLNGTGSVQTVTVTIISGTITNVSFASGNAGIAVLTTPDSTAPFTTTVTATGIGTTTYTATATDSFGNVSSATANITVNNPAGWFQTIDGDIVSAFGSISSAIPTSCTLPGCLPFLNIDPPPNSPGLAVAGGNINTGNGNVSTPNNHNVRGNPHDGEIEDYDFFFQRIHSPIYTMPTDTIDQNAVNNFILTSPPHGGGWHVVQLPCTAGTANNQNFDMLNRRTIIFVDCDLEVEGTIRTDNGRGNVIVVVSGDITVDPAVGDPADPLPDLEGQYVCDGTFKTPSAGPASDVPLHVRGSVKCTNFELERDLTDNSQTPAEVFEYGIDQNLIFPEFLARRAVIWREVAP